MEEIQEQRAQRQAGRLAEITRQKQNMVRRGNIEYGDRAGDMELTHDLLLLYVTQEVARRKREVKEKERTKELETRGVSEPTQEAAVAKTQKKQEVQNSQKEAMKRAATASKGEHKGKQPTLERLRNATVQLATPLPLDNPKVQPSLQGRRKLPTPNDNHGCKHNGLGELSPCDRGWIRAYIKVGAWLHQKPCLDCATADKTDNSSQRVLDPSVLLLAKGTTVAFICNCGPVGHKMGEKKGKEDYQCDMMLCVPCYNKRADKREEEQGGRRRSKRKSPNS